MKTKTDLSHTAPAADVDREAAGWLTRFDGAGCLAVRTSVEDLCREDAAFATWIGESFAHRTAFLRVLAAWQRADRLSAFTDIRPAPRQVIPGVAKLAAAVALFAVAGLSVLAVMNRTGEEMAGSALVAQTFETELGGQETVTLPDGSVIELNTDTVILADVTGEHRHVELLRGEAYFEIAHDPSRPFTIAVGDETVTVLGTKFSVQKLETGIEVMVTEGRVQIEERAAEVPLTYVAGGQRALTSAGSVLVEKQDVAETQREMSWRTGRLDFADTPLSKVAAEFNRYNETKLVIADDAAAQIAIGGSFKSNNVDAFARLLRDGLGMEVVWHAEEIRVHSSPQ